MIKYFILYLCIFWVGQIVHAQNYVESKDELSYSTLWKDTVRVYTDVYINDLCINPGTVVLLMDTVGIYVSGSLRAEGTMEQPIRFLVADTSGYTDFSSNAGGWKGIDISGDRNTDRVSLRYCAFEFVKDRHFRGAVHLNTLHEARVVHCYFSHNFALEGGAIYADNLDYFLIDSCRFIKNFAVGSGGAVSCKGGSPAIILSSYFYDNRMQLSYFQGYPVLVSGAAISVKDMSSPQPVRISNCQFFSNSGAHAVGISRKYVRVNNSIFAANYLYALSISTPDPDPLNINSQTVSNCIFYKNESFGLSIDNSKFEKVYNCIFWENNQNPFVSSHNQISAGFSGEVVYTKFDANIVQYGLEDINLYFTEGVNYTSFPVFKDVDIDSALDSNAIHADFRPLPGGFEWNKGSIDTVGLHLPLYDLDGNPRMVERIDIGPYEYNNVSTPTYNSSFEMPFYISETGLVMGLKPNESIRIFNMEGKSMNQNSFATFKPGVYIIKSSLNRTQKVLWLR